MRSCSAAGNARPRWRPACSSLTRVARQCCFASINLRTTPSIQSLVLPWQKTTSGKPHRSRLCKSTWAKPRSATAGLCNSSAASMLSLPDFTCSNNSRRSTGSKRASRLRPTRRNLSKFWLFLKCSAALTDAIIIFDNLRFSVRLRIAPIRLRWRRDQDELGNASSRLVVHDRRPGSERPGNGPHQLPQPTHTGKCAPRGARRDQPDGAVRLVGSGAHLAAGDGHHAGQGRVHLLCPERRNLLAARRPD